MSIGHAVAVLLLASFVHGDIVVSRTINSLGDGSSAVIYIEGNACSQHDQYGSNKCDIQWGSSITADYNVTLGNDLASGSKIDVDLTVDGFIPFKFSCDACGADCKVTVPIVQKTFDIKMPACPIAAKTLKDKVTKAIPAASPVPVKASLKGNVKVSDASGTTVLDMDVEGVVSPNLAE